MENQETKILIGREYPKQVIPLIEESKKSIKIIVYNWLWYPNQVGSAIQKFNNAIVRASKRGIDVKAIVQKNLISEVLQREKIKHRRIQSSKTLHTKLMIIDDEIVILGSHNYTMNAFNINYEISIIVNDKEIVNELIKYFSNFFY